MKRAGEGRGFPHSQARAPKQSKPARIPQKAGARRSEPPRGQIREDLAVELYCLIRLWLGKMGLTVSEIDRALERSRHLGAAPKVSGPLLRDIRGLCALLLEWSREREFIDSQGKPRVLAIRGPAATFETLARRFLPNKPLNEVIAMACATAEVVTRRGGTIALLGNILVNIAKSPETLLGHATRQIDQLLETILNNAAVHQKGIGKGRMERMVIGAISRADFNELMRELRPQIDDLLHRVDSLVQHRQPKTLRALEKATAVAVSVYVSQENDWERAGIDAASLVTKRRLKRLRRTD